MRSFIFDTSKGETPESLAKKRAIVDAITGQGIGKAPKTIGDGIAMLGSALSGRMGYNALDKEQKAGEASVNPIMDEIRAALAGRAAAYPSEVAAGASPTSGAATGTSPMTGSRGGDWLSYSNQGATRNQPLNEKLVNAMSFLPDLGVEMEVFSGGQPEAGKGARVGSVRHDHGNAGDVFFKKDGRRLNWQSEQDRPIFEEIVRRGRDAGVTGFGAGDGYMQQGSMHLGFGSPGVWGAGGKGSNAPDWLRRAYEKRAAMEAQGSPVEVASNDPSFMPDVSGGGSPFAPTLSQQLSTQAPVPQQANPYPEAGQIAPYDFTGNQQLSAAAGIPMEGIPQDQFNSRFSGVPQNAGDAINSISPVDPSSTGSIPPQAPAMMPQQPQQAMQSPFLPETMRQHDVMWGGALAPQGQAPQQVTDAFGSFPPAPSMQQQPQQTQQQGIGMVPMDKLMQAANNPWLSEQQRGMVNMLIKQQMEANDPSSQLDMDYKRAQIAAMQAKASGSGKETEYGLNPIWGQDEKGNAVLGVLGKDGSFKKVDTGQFDISSGTEQIDLGDSFAIKDKRSGQIIGTVPKNIANAAAQKEIGKAQGEAQASAPADYQAGQNAIDLLSNIRNDPYRQRGTGVSSMFNAVPGTGGYDFNQKVEQAKSGAFLAAIQQMRGMGSLSNAEGAAATAAITRMNTSMSEEGFLEALTDYEKIVVQGMDRAKSKLSPAETTPPQAGKRFRFNPQTGELE